MCRYVKSNTDDVINEKWRYLFTWKLFISIMIQKQIKKTIIFKCSYITSHLCLQELMIPPCPAFAYNDNSPYVLSEIYA